MKESTPMELVKRRDDLVARIARERYALAQNGSSVRPLVNWAGRLNEVVNFLGRRPAYLLLPAALITTARPRRFLGMVISGIGLWRLASKWRRYYKGT